MHRMARRSLLSLLGLGAPALAATGDGDGTVSLAGRLLVATAGLTDPNFARTLVLMVSHDGDGAFGLVVNRPYGTAPLAELLRKLGVGEIATERIVTVGYGGPVDADAGFLVHDAGYAGATTRKVTGRIAVTPDPQALAALARPDGPAQALVTLGYAGWGPGQLDGEVARGDWDHLPADPDLVFTADPAGAWEAAQARLGTEL